MTRRRTLALLATICGLLILSPAAVAAAPIATTEGATNITETSATLNGIADPTDPDSASQFQYGTTTSYGSNTQAVAIGSGAHQESATISGLAPGTTYHFRLIVLQGSYSPQMSAGQDVTFTTPESAPVLTGTPPTISGTAQQGQTLTESHGVWSNSPTVFVYQWYDCAPVGTPCAPIEGATGQTYTVGVADVGSTIRVVEFAGNAGGAGAATSWATAVVLPPAPAPTAPPPGISGVTVEHQTLTESHGGWSVPPTSYAYQWQDCNSAGTGCTGITGATGQTYTLGAHDVGDTIRVVETATDAGGTSPPASSAATGIVTAAGAPASGPVNSIPPSITGLARVGETLRSSSGAWSGTPPIAYSYRWQRCGLYCADIAGATGDAYRLAQRDRATRIRVVVTARNAVGSGSTDSAVVGPIAPSRPSRHQIRLRLSPLLHTTLSAQTLLAGDGHTFSFAAPEAGRLTLVWYARAGGHEIVLARSREVFERARTGRVKLKLTAAGARLLRHPHLLRVRAVGTFAPVGRRTVRVTHSFHL